MDKEYKDKYLNTVIEEIKNNFDVFDLESVVAAKDLILKAEADGKRVHITGIGKPGHVAGYIASLFSSTGTPAYFLDATECVHGSAGQVVPGDVVIAISNSGETQELKASIETLRNNEASIISVSGNLNSWLADHSEVALLAHVDQEGDSLNKPPRASILTEVMVLQLLSILLQESKNLDAKTYVKWHPGGSLGQSIREGK